MAGIDNRQRALFIALSYVFRVGRCLHRPTNKQLHMADEPNQNNKATIATNDTARILNTSAETNIETILTTFLRCGRLLACA
jgi:hypothetical protein